ncbi:hypothetical protein HZU75_06225 [Chitinibacter fontanus]|uniref:Uncharacterized protein n=1 Tax=Chitinibacter fontanus TaxID=1737446 RepID=A0A7D5V963_9NEIS|nr:hypothetical protein [Chitinibacter fontanus]QLI81158.1 hypothetical protein HZU75_06225 [Chitinibacter fontanus]
MKITSIHARNRIFSDYQIQKYAHLEAEQGDAGTDQDQAGAEHVSASYTRAVARWNGVERRTNPDRRQQTRRQYRVVSMLDTRTESDRRRQGRRQSDRLLGAFIACKV